MVLGFPPPPPHPGWRVEVNLPPWDLNLQEVGKRDGRSKKLLADKARVPLIPACHERKPKLRHDRGSREAVAGVLLGIEVGRLTSLLHA